MVTPGSAAVCPGTVMHHRYRPADHRFTYPVKHVWLDPDDPEALCKEHPLWSATRPAPIRFRRADYFDGGRQPIGPALRSLVAKQTDRRPAGPIRMLTQPRTWGWLFNPITIYLLWDDGGDDGPVDSAVNSAVDKTGHKTVGAAAGPVAAVLEVTNTPWKERHRYALALDPDTQPAGAGLRYLSVFDKVLHVSPFLDEDYRYRLRLSESIRDRGPRLTVELDVLPPDRIHPSVEVEVNNDEQVPILTTRLVVDRIGATRTNMTKALIRNPLPTHQVSFGIHRQAFALWRKRVRFVSHPKRRRDEPTDHSLEARS